MKLQCQTKLASVSVFLILLLTGCSNDSPLDINSDLVIPGQRGLAAQQLGPSPTDLDSVAAKSIPIPANYLLIANLEEIQSRVLIKFDTLASLSAPIDSAAKLTVSVTRNANDINSTYILLQVYKVTAAWDEKTVSWDNFTPDKFDPQPLATSLGSRGAASYTFSIDTSLVNSWRRQPQSNHGLLIDVLPLGVGMEIRKPVLQLNFKNRNVITQAASSDTLIFRPTSVPDLVNGPVYVGNYVGQEKKYQSTFYFNLDSIPKGATINRAIFKAQIDTLSSALQRGPVTVEFFLLKAPRLDPVSTPADSAGPYVFSLATTTTRQLEYTVTDMLQYAINNQGWYGFIMQSPGTLLDRSYVTFYSRETDLSRAPQLLVYYSLPPQGK